MLWEHEPRASVSTAFLSRVLNIDLRTDKSRLAFVDDDVLGVLVDTYTVYIYTVIKHNRHLRTQRKCRKHESQASVFYINFLKCSQLIRACFMIYRA